MIITNVKTMLSWAEWTSCDCIRGQRGFWGAHNISFFDTDDCYMGVWFNNSVFYVLFHIHAVLKKNSRDDKAGILCPNTSF